MYFQTPFPLPSIQSSYHTVLDPLKSCISLAYMKKIPHSKTIFSLIPKHVSRVRSDSKNKIQFIHHTREFLVRIQMNFKLFMNPAFELYTPLELNVSLNISRKTLAFVLNLLLLTLVYQFFSIQQYEKNKGRFSFCQELCRN